MELLLLINSLAARRSLALAGAAAFAVCAGCEPPETAAVARSIVGGERTTDHPAVVALVVVPTGCDTEPVAFCSGTLVAPRVVLTAAHCVDVAPIADVAVAFGADAVETRRRVRVAAAYPSTEADVALLELSDTVLDISPLSLAAISDGDVGASVQIVGFGLDAEGDLGHKREGTSVIDRVDAETFRIGPAPAMSCGGDSGGPVLLDGAIAGVTSYGDPFCELSGTNVRVDAVTEDFIAPLLADIETTPAVALPATEQPDCDATGCAAGGSPGGGAWLALAALALLGRFARNRR